MTSEVPREGEEEDALTCIVPGCRSVEERFVRGACRLHVSEWYRAVARALRKGGSVVPFGEGERALAEDAAALLLGWRALRARGRTGYRKPLTEETRAEVRERYPSVAWDGERLMRDDRAFYGLACVVFGGAWSNEGGRRTVPLRVRFSSAEEAERVRRAGARMLGGDDEGRGRIES